ncbi:MAG TPA: DNA mismatch repair protein MutL, partial [Clostridiales bacterium]|nr:DNA mismatch repair protein MutL [Clostridiales bacterium]
EEAYKPYTMNHKYPFTSLYIKMDPKSVDVNVHPTKLEVRFEEGNEIYDLIYNSIKNALTTKEHIRRIKLAEEKSRVKETKSVNKEAPEPFEVNRIRNTYLRETPKNQELSESAKETEIGKLREIVQDSSNIIKKQKNKNQEIEQYSFLSKEAIKEHRIIGQVFLTYWLVEYEEKLYIIDQHAAHEKVLYEKTIKDLKEKNILKQNLNPPIILTLSMREKEVVEKFKDEFSALGFEIEYFGGNEYAIREIPSDLDGLAQKDIFIELIDNLTDETYKQSSEVIIDKVASIACKAAVKGNQKLSTKEVHVLINSLLELENPYHCPHGRPTMILLSKYELEKRFKRVL